MSTGRLRIFVCHASDLFTDSQPHGDGLLAHAFVTRLAARGHTVHVAASGIALEKPLPEGVTVHPIPLRGGPELVRRAEFAFASRRLYERLSGRHGFDLVHQLNPVCTGISLAFLGCGVPVVLGNYVPHWPGERAATNPLLRFVGFVQQKAADALLISTPAALSRLPSVEATDRRVVVMPYGVDADGFRPMPNLAPAQPTVLFVASLERRKGIQTLLDAFPRVLERLPDAQLMIAGSGSERPNVLARASSPLLAGHVRVLGQVSREDLPSVIHASHVFCAPSFGEPYGMSAIEAMACGKPVVASDDGGLAHLIDERGGRRVAPGDAAALAGALIGIFDSDDNRVAMGLHNRCVVEQSYAWPRVVDRLESVYRAVLTEGNGLRSLGPSGAVR